jgi:hypothetical protein
MVSARFELQSNLNMLFDKQKLIRISQICESSHCKRLVHHLLSGAGVNSGVKLLLIII